VCRATKSRRSTTPWRSLSARITTQSTICEQSIRDSLQADEQNRARSRYVDKVLDALIDVSELVYPPAVIEDQIDAMMQDMDQRLRQFGLEGMNALLRQTRQTEDQYREQLRPEAAKIALRNLVLSEVIKRESIEASDEDIEARIRQIVGVDEAARSANRRRNWPMCCAGGGRTMIISQVLTEKAINLVAGACAR
jgi:hypothetical protein